MRLIDADHLVRLVNDATILGDGFKQAFTAIVNGEPTIEERKTGRWIKVNGKTAINCSACYHCSWSLSFEDTVKRFKFCPECGAKMEEGEQA